MRAQLDVPSYRCPLLKRVAAWRDETCNLTNMSGTGGLLLIGDNHADRTKTVLIDMVHIASMPLYLTKKSCRLTDFGSRPDCPQTAFDTLVRKVRRKGIKRVVAISHWPQYLSDTEKAQTVQNIRKLGIPVFLQLTTLSDTSLDPSTRLYSQRNTPALRRANVLYASAQFRDAAADIARDTENVLLIYPLLILCSDDCITNAAGAYMYRDSNHLTIDGVSLLSPLYNPNFIRNSTAGRITR